MGDKGKGVVATEDFRQREYVCEYSGELITGTVAEERERRYSKVSVYILFYQGEYYLSLLTQSHTQSTGERCGRYVLHVLFPPQQQGLVVSLC